ncbi:MAG: efflux RND transporter periplasmic adaptor subunit [Dokdonella sp.]|uniref:efflux RND transporter periplasmic adaptor subunit n=1 Tax=Dokdonella sp. TaxID=2291710 RepID=UPI0025BB07EB|nr:efflux RND transporter periplasmic adaptor subunit [Dokdonella sp.]MBZ0221949.1 efflux RND transporter periplasmic adaptor subunit [Dokdonella sp.]MCC7254883.1 efflux RND transporter periplasmic adaptor subunit [Dokdonella sp.]
MSRRKIALIAVAAVLVALVGWRMFSNKAPSGAWQRGADNDPVPVTVVAAVTQDVPVYLSALGTVQAFSTVTVNAQVSGQLKALHFAEGKEVKQGDLIAEIDPRTVQAALDQALARKKQDAAQLTASQSTLARYEELMKKNFVSAQDLENQRQTVRQQQALVAADDAAISSAQTQLSYTRISAPITGVAGIRQVDVGNLVSANGTGIVTLTQIHPINILFALPEQNLESVRNAQADDSAGAEVVAFDRSDAHEIAQGVLKVVDNQIDTATGTFKVKAQFTNADGSLWPGQFVNVRVKVRTVKGGIVVPATAVQRGPEGSYAYVLQADNSVQMKTVVPGGDAGNDTVLVSSGLASGERVVTEGQFRLKAGSKVTPLAPGEAPAAPTAEELAKLKAKAGSPSGGGRPRH